MLVDYQPAREQLTKNLLLSDPFALRLVGMTEPELNSIYLDVADCFKFRSRISIEVALDALRTGLAERTFTPAQILRAARLCRVDVKSGSASE